MVFAVPWLVWPVPLTTLVVLGYRCYRDKRLLEALPLLATQFNSALMWSFLAVYSVGVFNFIIDGNTILKGDIFSLRNCMITAFLNYMIFIEPMNLFLYTWRFLNELEQAETIKCLKIFFRWFAPISIVLVPLSFYCFVPAWIVEFSKFKYYFF
jgi:uncharacterized membrane protein YozB (DUF420 family)